MIPSFNLLFNQKNPLSLFDGPFRTSPSPFTPTLLPPTTPPLHMPLQPLKYNMTESQEVLDARKAMIAKRFGGKSAQTGGKGSMRRKKKAPARSTTGETDRKLIAAVKKLGATNIPGIEEVNLFKEDGKVRRRTWRRS